MNKILRIIIDVSILAYMFIAIGFSNSRKEDLLCSDININMIDTLSSGFLKNADIEKLILSEDKKVLGYPVAAINTLELEKQLYEMPYIKNAQIYFNLDGSLNIDILQRSPVLRVITRSNETFYLDKEGYVFPARAGFTPHVLIANGYFTDGNELKTARKLADLKDREKFMEWYDALSMAQFINSDDFWKSQVVQLYYNIDGDFEIIPRVGAHQIVFGRADELEERFNKLKILYNEGLDYEGWNKYEKIYLKYKNQVICTKR